MSWTELQAQKERASIMAHRENLEVGNNSIHADTEFADGYCNGKLYYYDTNHQFPPPLTSEVVQSFVMENLRDERATVQWNVGFVVGWLAALCENNPAFFFTSLL